MKLSSLIVISALALSFNVNGDMSDQQTVPASDNANNTNLFVPPEDDIEIGAALFEAVELSAFESQEGTETERYVPPEEDIEIGAAILE